MDEPMTHALPPLVEQLRNGIGGDPLHLAAAAEIERLTGEVAMLRVALEQAVRLTAGSSVDLTALLPPSDAKFVIVNGAPTWQW